MPPKGKRKTDDNKPKPGWFVIDKMFGSACSLVWPKHPSFPEPTAPADGVLMLTREELGPYEFASERQAQRAIERSVKYFTKHGLKTEADRYITMTRGMMLELADARRRGRKQAATKQSADTPAQHNREGTDHGS